MSNAVTTPNAAGLAVLQNLRAGLQQVKASAPRSASGTPLMRLLKDGQWVAGAEDTVIATGTEAIVNLMSFQSGYSCWTNRAPGLGKNELMGEEMWGINTPKPPASTLPVHHDPRTQDICAWKDCMGVEMKFLGGALKNQQALYKTTSVGGLRALTALLDEALAKIDEGSEYVFPIVAMKSDSYNHNSYGRTYVPDLEVVGWANVQGEEEDANGDGAPPAIDEVVKPEAPVAETAPAGRRRRL
jgi:hypothetical protein